MAVTRLAVGSVGPYAADGAPAGVELLEGVAEYAVDPTDPANQGIVDLDRVATGPDGLVRFSGDVRLLRPADSAARNGCLVVVAANRGMCLAPPGGEAALLAEGWSIAWCGWQWDVRPGPGLVALAAPEATDNGVPVGVQVRIEILTDAAVADHPLADGTGAFRRYPAADVADRDATLTERDWWDGARRPIDRSRWRFGWEADGRVVADDEHVWLEGGFRPGVYYELVYRSRISPVAGAGLLAFRDLGSHLRHGGPDVGDGHRHVFANGSSQSGRFVRSWLAEGLNLDEAGRQVYDGVFASVAGGRRNEVNHRGAQPALMYPVGFSTRPPFSTHDLLARQRAAGGVPRVMFTNGAWEYWLGDAALSHVEPGAGSDRPTDLPDTDEARTYLFAGVDHYAGQLGYTVGLPVSNHPNPLNPAGLARAAWANLVRWVRDGTPPPPSRVPRLADGTATTRAAAIAALPAIPGAVLPDLDALPAVRSIDLGPDADKGVGRWPAVVGDPLPDLVSALDADGNEIAGVRAPTLAVPLGTHTGWNPRRPVDGLPPTLYARAGSFWPFARTEEERRRIGDPRPSIAERYADRDDYLARVGDAADSLVAEGLLLADDVDAATRAAAALWDDVVGARA